MNRILRDPYYCGRLEDGTTSPQLEALKLRSDDTYEQILYILGQRQNKNEEKRHIALQTRGQAMLSGNIFCAHCGGRLTTIRYRDSYTRADGTEYFVNQIKYCCYHKSRKLCQCDGQTTYQADRVDETIRRASERYSAVWKVHRKKKGYRRHLDADGKEQGSAEETRSGTCKGQRAAFKVTA